MEPGIRIVNNRFVIDRDYLVLVFRLRKVMCVMQLLPLLIPLSIHDYLWAAFFSFSFWPSDPNFSDIIFLVKFHLYQVQTVPLNYKKMWYKFLDGAIIKIFVTLEKNQNWNSSKREEVLINCKTKNHKYNRSKMRFALGLPSGGLEKCIYVAEQFLKCLRKTEVRLLKSDIGLPWAAAAV